jgi:hypothetical protein
MEEGRTLAIIDWSELIMADVLLTRLDALKVLRGVLARRQFEYQPLTARVFNELNL